MPRVIPAGIEMVELVTGGLGWCLDGSQWREVRRGDLLWHGPGDWTIGRSHFDDPYRCLAVRFQRSGGRRVPHFTRWEDPAAIEEITGQAVRLFFDSRVDRAILAGWLYGRLAMAAHLFANGVERIGEGPVGAVCRALEASLGEPWPLARMAAEAGWSVPHFHDRFRAEIGTTPQRYLERRRLERACQLLVSTRLSIKEIAHACGYAGAANFTYRFRSRLDRTPGDFRRAFARP